MKNLDKFIKLANKLEVFQSIETIKEYAETYADIVEAAQYLSDREKYEILKIDYIKKNISTFNKIIDSIEDEQLKIMMLSDEEIFGKNVSAYMIVEFIKKMSDSGKEQVLISLSKKNESEGIGRFKIPSFYIKDIIVSMSDEKVRQIISNITLIEQLELKQNEKAEIIKVIKDDKFKEKIMIEYNLPNYLQVEIIQTFETSAKLKILKQNADELSEYDIIRIINTLDINDKIDFIKTNFEFLKNNKITVFDIVRNMRDQENSKLQLEFVYRLEELGLSEDENRVIIAGLENATKEKIDEGKINPRYAPLLKISLYGCTQYGDPKEMVKDRKIIPDFSRDLAIYKGLDRLLYLNPVAEKCNDTQREKIIELCKICPNVKVFDELTITKSTGFEFVQAEEWINFVLKQMKPEWTDIQKMAFIDTQIGKKISYAAEQGTEAEKLCDERALWKVIVEGSGVCNGIAYIEKYMYARAGIESEIISSKRHAFLMVKNVEIPNRTGGTVRGNTLVDPTWNINASKFGGIPLHFAVTYEELRKQDIDDNGIDHNSHRKDELEQVELIGLDEDTLRKVYSSVGLADKDGNFPIKHFIDKVAEINDSTPNFEENIRKKIDLLKGTCPEFATCINSTTAVMKSVLFKESSKFRYDRCIVSRVFEKNDSRKEGSIVCVF